VPGFFWNQAGRADYTHTHHTQYDTYDAAIAEYQMHSSVVIATGALGLANLPELLTRENMKVQRGFGGGRRAGGRLLGVVLDDDGVTITDVSDGSVAAQAGLKAGDRIVRIGDKVIKEPTELRAAMTDGPAKNTVTFVRGGAEQTVAITFER
jgi:S1-C subfamily serine protease